MSRSSRYTSLSRFVEVEYAHDVEEKEASAIRLPVGIRFVQKCIGRRIGYDAHKYLALVLTFLIYATYHASRRPLNVVKPLLSPYDEVSAHVKSCSGHGEHSTTSNHTTKGWEPFIGKSGEKLLVGLDFTFLFSYAIGVILAGRIADRSNLRHYLLWGMVGSGVVTAAFGLGYFWGIHSYAFYLILQMATGLFQASGWPAVIAIVAQWFGKDHLGLVMGIWNAHASVGNSVGSALSASVVHYGWGSAFLLLGSFIAATGILLWFFIVPQPIDAGYCHPAKREAREQQHTSRTTDSLAHSSGEAVPSEERRSITWMAALSIPGVIPFSIALFFSKFVAYTFLFWLPYYIASICINGHELSAEQAGDFSILFDIGGIVGGAIAGILYDMSHTGAVISAVYGLCSIPLLLIYNQLGRHSIPGNMTLLFFCGFCVNGPYALITTAVSATLGTHESIAGNERALSTVAAIIDGMGSLGAALGPTLTGEILSGSARSGGGGGSFNHVFVMLTLASLFMVLTLARVAWIEIKTKKRIVAGPETIEMEKLVRKSTSG